MSNCNTDTLYTVKTANKSDMPTLIANTLTMAEESEGRILDKAIVTRGVLGIFASPQRGTYWIAHTKEGDIAASVLITTEWSDWNANNYWWVQSVYIAPEHRGKGLMKHFVDTINEAAKAEGVPEIRLYVDVDNIRATKAYEKCGFKKDHYDLMIKPVTS